MAIGKGNMAKHRGNHKFGCNVFQEYLRLKNRWLFFIKPDLKKGIKNVLGGK